MNGPGVQWRGGIFILEKSSLKMTVLLHKIALVNFPMVTTVINNLVSELKERWSHCTNEEDLFWEFVIKME